MPEKPIHILLVEDNPADARLLRELMAEGGGGRFRLTHVDRLAAGLERLALNGIDVVLLDLSLPDSQGPDTLTRLQAAAPGVPIVVLTGLDDEALGVSLVQAGAQDYLVKGQVTSHFLAHSVRYAIERKRLEEQLRQSQKLDAIGQLAGGIAHDFNNLLTVINGYCEFLLYPDLCDPDLQNQYLEEIHRAGQQAASLARQLLAFSRKQVLQVEVLNLNEVVANVNKMLQRLIGEDIDLVTILEDGLGQLKADPGQLEQVIINLAINARDAMPQGGKLTIETANVELDELYAHQHAEVKPGAYVLLAVSDTGIGMDKETLARIYEPFFTTKEQGKGTGLGLATVYGIVKQSGGHIWVYSEVGRGTTFKIYLPRVEERVEPIATGLVSVRLAHGAETILLVEDADGVRNLLYQSLQINGYTILAAHSGVEALQICTRRSGPLHLLVTDMIMPGGLNGRELAERLTSLYPELKVLYMSGYTGQTIVHHGLEHSVAFLQKPFTLVALLRKIREILDAPLSR